MTNPFDPLESLASMRHEFGEHGGVNMSIEASTTFTVMHPETMPDIFHGLRGPDAGGCYLYGRHFNPTVYVLGRELAALEGTEAAYGTSSGMSAIATTLLQICEPGDHIVAGNVLYGGTFALLNGFLPKKTGVRATLVDVRDLRAVESAFTEKTRALYVETLSNPTLIVADLPKLAAMAHAHGAKLVVDNTFCPLIMTPARHGADVVIHSMTKFLSGASDIVAGVVCSTREFIMQLMDVEQGALMLLGPTMDPRIAFELSLRLPHLGIRMKEHSRRAQAFAERLAGFDLPVLYPGLDIHPQHDLLRSLSNTEYGSGGIFCLDLKTKERAFQLMELLQNRDRFGYIAVSLGYFDTLMSCSASSTSSEMPEAVQARAGLSPGLVRFSVGYTGSLEQRWEELEDAIRVLGLIR